MKTGGKRKSIYLSNSDSEEADLIMSSQRKRMKLDNNNDYKQDQDDSSTSMQMTNLSEMGVSLLPSSDNEEASDSEQLINQITDKSDESSLDSVLHKSPLNSTKHSESVMITPPEQLLSYKSRRSIKGSCKQDMFSLLSDEIILMILQWLPRQSLSDCALVCHRWRQITYDESLWQRIDLTGSVIKTDYMGYVLHRNPVILRMAQAEVTSPMFKEMAPAMEDFLCQVQYLDLSMALISPEDLAQLLGRCRKLKKLSLEHCTTDTAVCSSIAANPDLETLNMSQCYKVDATGLEEILINCSELVDLNLAWTRLDGQCIDIVCKLVNENIRRLNLSGGLKWMKDSHVKELVSRCTCLTDLDLSDCTELTANCLDPIVNNLCDIQQLSFSRCYNILLPKYVKLVKLASLKFVNLFGLMQQERLDDFEKSFTYIKMNHHRFSTIARPTVGIRRTSIWGLRVRD